jgi:septal ring-binding cell division protein DamX
MSDDTKPATLCARLEAIIKEVEAAAVRHRIQAARLPEEESKATALEQTATAAHQCVLALSSSPSSHAPASQLIPTASSTYENTVVAGFHLQVAAVLNIRQLVNIVLDSSSTNYVCWCDLMEQVLQHYALIKHIMDDTLSNDPGWIRMDSVILNWISNSILADLHQVV